MRGSAAAMAVSSGARAAQDAVDQAPADVGGHFMHELPFGANRHADGRTRFRLWAPAQRQVLLLIEDEAPLPMQAVGDGVFEVETRCDAGTAYRYGLDDGSSVPDPAARAQRDGVHGASLVVDPLAYRWQHPRWRGRPWHETVIYELHAGACGGYAGVAERLPQLAALGVTAIELMPIAHCPGSRNWGYDGVLPYAPQADLGEPDRLKALVDAAHGLGLMVFLDVVYNHFGPDGNHLARYAPSFFRDDVSTPWGSAIDFREDAVRRYFTHNALYWLHEYRFDGLRFDAVHAITDCGWLDEAAREIRASIGDERHVHLVLENDDNTARHLRREATGGYDAQWNDDVHHALHVLLTGEDEGYYRNFADDPARHLARCLGEGFAYQGEFSPSHGRERGTPSAGLPPQAFVAFLQNHDQIGNRALGERLSVLADEEALHAAVALLLLMPQIPMLFMGEEWGSRTPFLYFTDHHGELAAAVRDGRRREFAHFASFGTAPERIPDPNDPGTFAASIPDAAAEDADRVRRWEGRYRHLLALRHEWLVPRLSDGRAHSHGACVRALAADVLGQKAVCARWQLCDGSRLTVATNLGGDSVGLEPPSGRLLYDSAPAATAQTPANRLPGRCTRVYLECGP